MEFEDLPGLGWRDVSDRRPEGIVVLEGRDIVEAKEERNRDAGRHGRKGWRATPHCTTTSGLERGSVQVEAYQARGRGRAWRGRQPKVDIRAERRIHSVAAEHLDPVDNDALKVAFLAEGVPEGVKGVGHQWGIGGRT